MDLATFLHARADDLGREADRTNLLAWGVDPADLAGRMAAVADRLRVQADVVRRLVKLHTEAEPSVHECMGDSSTYGIAEYDDPCPTLRLLGLMFAGHPDYDQGWLP